jgi:hypothetical protein
MKVETYRIVVGIVGVETDAERQQLAADLEDRFRTSSLEIMAIRRESERPGETMDAGAILNIDVAAQVGRKLLEGIRSWLASQRTELEVQAPNGLKIKISAANFEEALELFKQANQI